ncbi:MAG: cobalt-precorrin-5B (C(1))-methyltransferase CbiD [Nostocaceae cyanobacterium]|nr:cobalt-precorrin-5B (C(1))-methyltransferase CbiD [Nostocaceae cyanobacterium]
MFRSGYTLPVFATAASMAALQWLRNKQPLSVVSLNLITPVQMAEIPIEQVAGLSENTALAITRSNPGDNLDLTRNTPIWSLVESREKQGEGEESIIIRGGEGIGKQLSRDGQAAIYTYAQRLLRENLQPMLALGEQIVVTIILPEGRSLAVRTSNAAFGVVEGLSLLGTTGISQPLTAPGQLAAFEGELQHKAKSFDCLVFCLGENGLDLATKQGINPQQLVKTANWLGSMLVAAAVAGVKEILLFGYHGKLIKLAGGIFHTHHHLADGRKEILAAHCAIAGLRTQDIQRVFDSPTAEAGLTYLRTLDANSDTDSDWVNRVYGTIVEQIDTRCQEYITNHVDRSINITVCGSILFDRDRQVFVKSKKGGSLMAKLC